MLYIFYSPYAYNSPLIVTECEAIEYRNQYNKKKKENINLVIDDWDKFFNEYYFLINTMTDVVDIVDIIGDQDISIKIKLDK